MAASPCGWHSKNLRYEFVLKDLYLLILVSYVCVTRHKFAPHINYYDNGTRQREIKQECKEKYIFSGTL
jgi:hypothetical protein